MKLTTTEENTMAQTVTVLGGNLSNKMDNKGMTHIHAAGCGDIGRNYTKKDVIGTFEIESIEAYIKAEWYDFLDEGCSVDEILADFYIAPCVEVPIH
jgi:hypothetical protein